MIHFPFVSQRTNITNCDISAGTAPHRYLFKDQITISYPASDQTNIRKQCLHETVMRSAQHLILLRLVYAALQIASGIQNTVLVHSVDD